MMALLESQPVTGGRTFAGNRAPFAAWYHPSTAADAVLVVAFLVPQGQAKQFRDGEQVEGEEQQNRRNRKTCCARQHGGSSSTHFWSCRVSAFHPYHLDVVQVGKVTGTEVPIMCGSSYGRRVGSSLTAPS